MSTPTRQVNIAVELRSGRHYGVFIDDTGSPGLKTPGLNEQRKSWVAVIVPPHQVSEVMNQLPSALSFLKELGIKDPEFHFTDIWAGKGEFKQLNLQQRLGIFRFMSHIFTTYQFPVLVQTFDPENAADVQRRTDWPEKLGPLKFSDHEDLALIFALLRVRMHLKAIEGGKATACVVVDEGRLASGKAIVLSGLAPTFVAGAVLFASSRLVHPIQLADFAAFVMNRWQLLRVKESLSSLDKTLLEIISPVAEFFINIDPVSIQGFPNIANLRQGMS
ncbi:hypothetical protein [Hydrogenophaga pseudoflava]|uniref:DUF3800 domain-containing protein n=1 Tax=Hydrogenophaga pseudoflava TaxID=47421 RepID=A0A4P6X5I4_HYDPS|nr:hypothetical protein [Hydrogenophaga pseudoflava]QBM29031.1 hypothetical protein HPF_15150 [Hydrogenophaga pseudoflava]